MVYRVFVSKRKAFAVEASKTLNNLKTQLKLNNLNDVKIVHRYDVEGVSLEILKKGINIILSEPMVDDVTLDELDTNNAHVIAIEYLPGQYDQRADACEQCFQLLTGEKNVKVKCAKLIVLYGSLDDKDVKRIQDYLINPVDQRLASLDKAVNLFDSEVKIDKVPVINSFNCSLE